MVVFGSPKGGRWHVVPQLAVYTTYIPLIYCLLGGYMLPTTLYRNLKNPLILPSFTNFCGLGDLSLWLVDDFPVPSRLVGYEFKTLEDIQSYPSKRFIGWISSKLMAGQPTPPRNSRPYDQPLFLGVGTWPGGDWLISHNVRTKTLRFSGSGSGVARVRVANYRREGNPPKIVLTWPMAKL